jgi:predicted MFS family arabinose efflux permease
VAAAALVGTAVAPILTTQVAAHIGWRWSFFVAGVPGMILGLIIWWYVEEPQRKDDTSRPNFAEFFTVLRYRNVVLCCLAGAANLTSLFFYAVFAPLYITEVAHQAPTTAGLLMGAGGFGAFFAGVFYPSLSDRIGRKPILVFLAASSIFLPLSLLVPALYGHLWLFAAVEFVLSTSQAIPSIVLVLIPTETVPARLGATAIGAATMSSEFIGATVAPTIGGIIAQQIGLDTTMMIAAGANVVLFLICLGLKETRGRRAVAMAAPA